MDFDWDVHNLLHIARHDVTAEEVEFALGDRTLDLGYQDWHDEERFAEVGKTANGRLLTIVTTWRGSKIRVVTAYDASDPEANAHSRMMVS